MSGKHAFLALLKQEGVEIMFGNPGTTELPLMDAFATENELRYLLGLQEAAVMGMADGYAQASGKLTVVNLHVAPGLGNAMGMLYDAQKAGSPILVTAGQHEQSFTATEPILWADLPTIARPLVKWSSEVHRLADLPRLVHRAAKTALAPPTGPVFLSLPGDILRLGPEVRRTPSPYDALFSVGGDLFTLSLPSEVDPMPAHLKLIHLDSDPWELGKNYPPAVAILGDPKATLPELTAAVRERMSSGARGAARERFAAATKAIAAERDALTAKARALAHATPVQPLAFLHAIGETLPKDAVVIEEALSSAPGIRQLIRSDDPQS